MPTILTYWCLPEEEDHLLNHLSNWQIYAYPPDAFPSISDVKPVPLQSLIRDRNPSQFDFGLKQFLSEKDIGRLTLLNGGHGYGAFLMQAHTIGYRRPCYRVEGHLGQANLAAYWRYQKDGQSIEKNSDFVKWGKKIFAWGRKWASEKVMLNGHPYPATKKVKELVEQNKLTVGI